MERMYLRVQEAAEVMSISKAKAYALIAEGKLPAVKIGETLRVPVEALRRLTESSETTAAQ